MGITIRNGKEIFSTNRLGDYNVRSIIKEDGTQRLEIEDWSYNSLTPLPEITINQNGTYDLQKYKLVIVNVDQVAYANEFDLLLTGNYNFLTEELCDKIITGNYVYYRNL